MREHPLKAILSKILRGGGDPSEFELGYVHRGAVDDQMVIKVSEIIKIGKGSFILSDGETQIPFHRVLYVLDPNKKLLWRKRVGELVRRPLSDSDSETSWNLDPH